MCRWCSSTSSCSAGSSGMTWVARPLAHEQLETGPGVRRHQQLDQLVAHPLGRDDLDRRGHLAHRRVDLGGGHEPELRDEPGGAHHPQRVVAERHLGRRGRAQQAGVEVDQAAVRVDEGEVGQAQRHRVDREVAPHQVVLEGVAEGHDRLAGLAVVGVGAVGGHLDDGAAAPGPDGAEVAAHVPGRRAPGLEHGLGGVRPGRGGEVQVGRGAAEQGVAHRAPDERQVVPRGREPLTEVGQQRQVGRQMGDGLAQQGGRWLTGGHEDQGYAARDGSRGRAGGPRGPPTAASRTLVTVTG